MKNTFGCALSLTIFGESHGPVVGVVIDGLAPGIKLDEAAIAADMDLRRATGSLSTPRKESDRAEFLSGVYKGRTTGTPLCIIVRNLNTRSEDYAKAEDLLRPGHADYTAKEKYLGFADPRGGGHFSGRLTAPIVAAGAICRSILLSHGIVVGSHLAQCADIHDDELPAEESALTAALLALHKKPFATLSSSAAKLMQDAILKAKSEQDSVGGVLQTAVTGVAAGVGEPFFSSVESVLSSLLFSVPAVKAVEFGLGTKFAPLRGSAANDAFAMGESGRIITTTNNNGGINGGITNGMPILLRTTIKPTPSIGATQNTVDVANMQNACLSTHGRHDPCILHRARVVADAMVCIGLVDLYSVRHGILWQQEGTHGKL